MVNYNLKAERVKRNKDQSYVSKLLGISVPAYSQKECGKRRFTVDEVKIIADDFNLNGNEIKEIFFTEQVNTNSKCAS